ncbi:MAG: hypothetical protein ACE5JL_10895 [Dehalococcoidia bacterium]
MPEHDVTKNLEGDNLGETPEESSAVGAEESKQDTPEEPGPVPYDRFKEVIDQKNQAEAKAKAYAEIGSPDEISEALEIAATLLEQQKQEKAKKDQTPAEAEEAALREELLKLLKPELEVIKSLKQHKVSSEENTQAQQAVILSRAEDRLGTLLKETGFEPDAERIEEVGNALFVMGSRDPKAIQRFRSGDISVVDDLYSAWKKRYLEPAARKLLADTETTKRGNVTPKIPEGGGFARATGKSKEASAEKPEKTAHDLAWELLNKS